MEQKITKQATVASLTDLSFTAHLTGPQHPESPSRILAILEALKNSELAESLPRIAPRLATEEEIAFCHTQDYIDLVRSEVAMILRKDLPTDGSLFLSTGDVCISPRSFEIALLAAGSALAAVDHVMQNNSLRAFAAIRPPGHHAFASTGKGFCLFNNVAIAASYAKKVYGLKNVLIVDFDVHHGDGTEALFYEDPSVFYFSTHRLDPGFYPGTGFKEEVGQGKGIGTTLNCPYSISQNDSPREIVIHAFQETLPHAIKDFFPELILISAGFDAHCKDPIGGADLTDEDFATITKSIVSIANKHCSGRIVSLLEGGYSLDGLASGVISHIRALSDS